MLKRNRSWLFEGRHTFDLEPLDVGRPRLRIHGGPSELTARLVTDAPEPDSEAMDQR
ncbi:hypothetical protein [Salinigranum rubrum]|uniref:hypothetical protein n=1 Tax=Salinigranum rubrum TaxID=755307 RepID=UPI0013A58932|nr:hypothetical protein [Salinigranum rubrum]